MKFHGSGLNNSRRALNEVQHMKKENITRIDFLNAIPKARQLVLEDFKQACEKAGEEFDSFTEISETLTIMLFASKLDDVLFVTDDDTDDAQIDISELSGEELKVMSDDDEF